MLFNSIEFAIFLPIVFALYWFAARRPLRLQNLFIVAASYFFYGWWDYRFLALIIFSTAADYVIALALEKQTNKRKRRLLVASSLGFNLITLGFFKYFNFFADSFVAGFTLLGWEFDALTLEIALPVGISFYTFQTLSYTLDVYKGRMRATRDFIAFSAFVSFFPQLVAGPIERASHLLPQMLRKRVFDYGLAVDGLRQILWGLFKKVVVADSCAVFANQIFNDYETMPGSALLLGALLFSIQIYGDFSGYSDIAIGTARLFGFDLMQNFAFPYFSRDIAEFWRRWHISLSTWFRDYLYIPLGGSRGPKAFQVRNVMIIFVVSGFWHGANWTFIAWGFLNAVYFLPLLLSGRNRAHVGTVAEHKRFPSLKEAANMLATFALVALTWIFFRAESISQALAYIGGVFSASLFQAPGLDFSKGAAALLLGIPALFVIDWFGRTMPYGLAAASNWRARRALYAMLFLMIVFLRPLQGSIEFIYFQF